MNSKARGVVFESSEDATKVLRVHKSHISMLSQQITYLELSLDSTKEGGPWKQYLHLITPHY